MKEPRVMTTTLEQLVSGKATLDQYGFAFAGSVAALTRFTGFLYVIALPPLRPEHALRDGLLLYAAGTLMQVGLDVRAYMKDMYQDRHAQ